MRYQGKSPTHLRWNRFDWKLHKFWNQKVPHDKCQTSRKQISLGRNWRRVWLGDKHRESFRVLWALNHSSPDATLDCSIWTTHVFGLGWVSCLQLPINSNANNHDTTHVYQKGWKYIKVLERKIPFMILWYFWIVTYGPHTSLGLAEFHVCRFQLIQMLTITI